MSELPDDRANYCYRHPSRQSFMLCQRCGRTICTSCQTQAAVGVHCPECVKEARANAPRAVRAARSSNGRPLATYTIIALCVLVFAAQTFGGSSVTSSLLYFAPNTLVRPWTIITAMFAHGGFMHLAFNMFSLFVLGSILERSLGRLRFVALYFISGFGGAVAVLWLTPGTPVLGASGAIFGLLGALFILVRRMGGNTAQIVIVLAINLVIGFILPNIAWQAHLGGLLVGAAVAAVYVGTRGASKATLQAGLVVGVTLVVAAIGAARFLL